MTTRKANNELAQAMDAIKALQAQIQALASIVVPQVEAQQTVQVIATKGKKTKAQKETPLTEQQKRNQAIKAGLEEYKDMTLAQVIARIAPTGKANRKQKTYVNDWSADKVPTAELLKYFPIVQRSAFKSAWKAAQKTGSVKTRAQALALLEIAMK